MALATQAPDNHAAYVAAHRSAWNAPPRQRTWRCVDHMLSLFARTIATYAHVPLRVVLGAPPSEVADVVNKFQTDRRAGIDANGCAPPVMPVILSPAAAAAAAAVDAALRRVEFFTNLSDEQFNLLREGFVEASYERGDFIFEQGVDGDSFYVIVAGTADVVRAETAGAAQVVIAELAAGAHFGERALLHHEPRYAGIKVSSPALRAMSITRAALESAIGPLVCHVPDLYK